MNNELGLECSVEAPRTDHCFAPPLRCINRDLLVYERGCTDVITLCSSHSISTNEGLGSNVVSRAWNGREGEMQSIDFRKYKVSYIYSRVIFKHCNIR